MVVQSRHNYKLHKEQIHEIIKKKYGEDKADIFLNHFSKVYDEHGRGFLDYRLAFSLMDDWHHCKNIGTRWYAFVGVGGSGKSTLAKNVFKFLDPTFNLSRSTTEMRKMIEILGSLSEKEYMKAIYLDEPDDEIVAQSKQGKKLRKIFGKIRQQKCFLGVCATDLNDIPPYMFRKIDGIFFTPYLGKFMFFKNRPKQKSYILQEIRKKYADKGYSVFFQLQKRNKVGCLYGRSHKATPLDSEEKKYLIDKRKDFEKDIKDFIKIDPTMSDDERAKKNRDKVIMKLHDKGNTLQQIGDELGITKQAISRVVQRMKFL